MSLNLVAFPKIYLGLWFWNFFPIFELVFAVLALFDDQMLFCVCVFYCYHEYILDNISRIWVQKA